MITLDTLEVKRYRLEKERNAAQIALYRLEGALIFLDELQGQLRKERIAVDSGGCDQKVPAVLDEEERLWEG